MNAQTTCDLLMIRPASFGFNEQTAGNNEFQSPSESLKNVAKKAIKEFNAMKDLLVDYGIRVHVIQDKPDTIRPDAVFPNNWLSTHQKNTLVTWPMYAPNRRLERRKDTIKHLERLFQVEKQIHFEGYEDGAQYLEGTGSLVLDRENKTAYACLSDRTHAVIIDVFCKQFGYQSVVFHALDQNGKAIYHTNVMMSIGTKTAVVCLESILEESRALVKEKIKATGKTFIEISYDQMNAFAGNMLEVRNTKGDAIIIMSKTAQNALDKNQLAIVSKNAQIVVPEIPSIEIIGGGSVRCMLCEIFLEPLFQ